MAKTVQERFPIGCEVNISGLEPEPVRGVVLAHVRHSDAEDDKLSVEIKNGNAKFKHQVAEHACWRIIKKSASGRKFTSVGVPQKFMVGQLIRSKAMGSRIRRIVGVFRGPARFSDGTSYAVTERVCDTSMSAADNERVYSVGPKITGPVDIIPMYWRCVKEITTKITKTDYGAEWRNGGPSHGE